MTEEELLRWCRGRLNAYEVPRRIVITETELREASGQGKMTAHWFKQLPSCHIPRTMTTSVAVAVSGIGMAGRFKHQDQSGLVLASRAFQDALVDAGLEKGQIDGLVVNIGGPAGPDYDQFARYTGISVSAAYQTWAHGRFTTTCLQLAQLVVNAGLATHVACVRGYHLSSGGVGGSQWKGWEEENRVEEYR